MVQNVSQCRLIIDSCCDLPYQLVADTGVGIVNASYTLNDGEHRDDMWQHMSAEEFYGRLRNGEMSRTSQVSMSDLTEAFEHAAQEGTPTVYLAFSGGISGTYGTADMVAKQIREKYPDFELYVVDTLLACGPEGLLVLEAIKQRDRGLTAKQLADWANEARWFVNTLFTLDGLDHLAAGGRIPDTAALAGGKLNIKPLLSFDTAGALKFSGITRGRRKSLKSLTKEYQENKSCEDGSDLVIVGSADAASDAKWVAEHLGRPETAVPPLMTSVGPTIGSHVGPGMVFITFWGKDRRESASIADRIANKLK